nr:hypothetical protein [Tanacetum cinerariifolium]
IRQRHIDKDPCVSASSGLFAFACGPTPTPISVNSCVVNGVRFVVHSHDEGRTTQNNDICSSGDKNKEMYYGQLEEIVEFSLKDLDFATLHIDAQSMDVDALPDTIDVNEDDDIIDDEDALPHDLADSDDEDLVNVDVDDDDVAVVYSNVSRCSKGHGGDGGGDDRLPPHQIGCGNPKTHLGRQESRHAEYPQRN